MDSPLCEKHDVIHKPEVEHYCTCMYHVSCYRTRTEPLSLAMCTQKFGEVKSWFLRYVSGQTNSRQIDILIILHTLPGVK